jgi:hypothetical protein
MNVSRTPDRKGFTIDASLAWTILVVIVGASFWFGNELAGVKNAIGEAKTAQQELAADRRETDLRIRGLEQLRVGDARDLANMAALLQRIDQRLERIEQRGTTP